MKNAKVELNKWKTSNPNSVEMHEAFINGVRVLLTQWEYEAIEKTL